jgi:hypothetical protein
VFPSFTLGMRVKQRKLRRRQLTFDRFVKSGRRSGGSRIESAGEGAKAGGQELPGASHGVSSSKHVVLLRFVEVDDTFKRRKRHP